MHTCIFIYVYVHVCCLSNLPTSRCVIVGFTKKQELCLQSLDCTTVMVGHGHCWMRRNLVVDSCKSSGKMQLYNAMHQLKKWGEVGIFHMAIWVEKITRFWRNGFWRYLRGRTFMMWCGTSPKSRIIQYNGDFFLICFFFFLVSVSLPHRFSLLLYFSACLLLCLSAFLLLYFSAFPSFTKASRTSWQVVFFFCERSERLGVWGRCFRTGPFFHTQLVFRVSPGSVLQDNVPARTWVMVGCRFSPSSLILGLNR